MMSDQDKTLGVREEDVEEVRDKILLYARMLGEIKEWLRDDFPSSLPIHVLKALNQGRMDINRAEFQVLEAQYSLEQWYLFSKDWKLLVSGDR
jgi:hypothetical protein